MRQKNFCLPLQTSGLPRYWTTDVTFSFSRVVEKKKDLTDSRENTTRTRNALSRWSCCLRETLLESIIYNNNNNNNNNNGRRIRDDDDDEEDKIDVECEHFLDLVGPGDNPPALLGLGVDRCGDEMHRRRLSFGRTVFGAKHYHE